MDTKQRNNLARVEHRVFLSKESALRHMLDGGGCVLVGDRWFGPDSTAEERNRHLRMFNARLERNRRRRERRRAMRVAEAVEAKLARLPARTQTRLTGRTAVREGADGRAVDYAAVYAPRADPFAWPFPHGATPVELMLDGGRAAAEFVGRVLRAHASKPRRAHTAGMGTGEVGAAGRLRAERRKLCVRSTLAAEPTATDVRVAWAFARESHANMLRLGGLLQDLECHVSNRLVVIRLGSQPKIRARLGGIHGWLRENCPELVGKYKTLMRYKALAKRLRQAAEVADPVPTAAALDDAVDAHELLAHDVRSQPRAGGERVLRFAWERGHWCVDASGRPFRANENYHLSSGTVALALAAKEGRAEVERGEASGLRADRDDAERRFAALLASAREAVRGMLSDAAGLDIENYGDGGRPPTFGRLWEAVGRALVVKERWWTGAILSLE